MHKKQGVVKNIFIFFRNENDKVKFFSEDFNNVFKEGNLFHSLDPISAIKFKNILLIYLIYF